MNKDLTNESHMDSTKFSEVTESTSTFIFDSATNINAFDKNYFVITTGILVFSVSFIKDIIDLKNSAPLVILILSWVLIAGSIGVTLYSFWLFGHSYKQVGLAFDQLKKMIKSAESKFSTPRNPTENLSAEENKEKKEIENLNKQLNDEALNAANSMNEGQSDYRALSMILFSVGLLLMLVFIAWSLTKEKNSFPNETSKDRLVDSIILNIKPDTLILKSEYSPPAYPQVIPTKQSYILQQIYFDFNQWSLRPESYRELDSLTNILNIDSSRIIEISAYTDNMGSDLYNLKLSQKRANVVKSYLVQHNIASKRVLATGYGKISPVGDNDTNEGRQRNRRIEFRFLN